MFNIKAIILLSIVFCAIFNSCVPDANLKRNVLYRLRENETVPFNAYCIQTTADKNNFACLVEDTVAQKVSFIFNGKLIDSVSYSIDSIFHIGQIYKGERIDTVTYNTDYDESEPFKFNLDQFKFYYLNYEEKDGFVYVKYRNSFSRINHVLDIDNGSSTINIIGKKYEGKDPEKYHDVYLRYNNNDKGYIFTYKLVNGDSTASYVNINGRIEGPFEKVELNYDSDDLFSYKYNYDYLKENGKVTKLADETLVNINGIVSPSYEYVSDLYYFENGRFAYRFIKNNKVCLNINGTIINGHSNLWNLIYFENGNYAYCISNNEKNSVNINGAIYYAGDSISTFYYFANGKYAYSYMTDGKKDGSGFNKYYVNINGTVSKGYDNIGFYSFLCFLNYNGFFDYYENGDYRYYFWNNRKKYACENGKITEVEPFFEDYYKTDVDIVFSTPNGKHTFFSDYEHKYILIDDTHKIGIAPAMKNKTHLYGMP